MRLPPLNALRAFEATSRLLSAKQAAAELYVTPAAISHQIKLLESYLGLPLFQRFNRQLILTEAGRRYAGILHHIFKKLTDETQKLTQSVRNLLTISVEPAFAIYWLLPRLEKFKQLNPNIELRVAASYVTTDFSQHDVAIRWGSGQYPGLSSTLLFRNELFPVCNPSLLKKQALRQVNDLQHYTLLHETTALAQLNYPNWHMWLSAAGATAVNPESGLYFETGYLLIQAAIEGQGIALERAELVKSSLQTGKLIRLFKLSLCETHTGYYLVFPEAHEHDNKIQAFQQWLTKEIREINSN